MSRERLPGHGLRTAAVVGLAVLSLAGCTLGGQREEPSVPGFPEFDRSAEQPLLTGNWHYMPGADRSGDSLIIHHTGEAVLTLPDTWKDAGVPEYIANPPSNLYGTHLELQHGHDFGVTAGLEDITGSATVSLAGLPTIRYDERLQRRAGITVTIGHREATVVRYDARGRTAERHALSLPGRGQRADLVIAQEHGKTLVSVDGRKVTLVGAPFGAQVWFGMDTPASFRLTSLNAYPIAGTELASVDSSRASYTPAAHGLTAAASTSGHGDRQYGTAIDLAALVSDPQYTQFVIDNFNEIETETLAKFQALQPERGRYQFAELDALVDFAHRHGLTVHGHALVFGEAYPQWLYSALRSGSPATAGKLMQEYITTVMTRYDGEHGHGTISYWDVVNEPFDPDDWGQLNKNNLWYRAIGENYIAMALETARAANPRAVLGINEWGLEIDADRQHAMIALLENLKRRGAAPDFVGLQAHFDEGTLDDVDAMSGFTNGRYRAFLDQLSALGVRFRISEASVAENGNARMQAEVYAALMDLCVQNDDCIGVNVWGATSNEYYFTTEDGTIGDDAPTVQKADGSIEPRPAWTALRQAVSRR